MSKTYKVIILPHFRKQLKPLAKKYPSLKRTFIDTFNTFETRTSAPLGHGLYKVRLSPKELNKGKSKSLRCITLCIEQGDFLVPVTIYSKADRTGITTKELESHTEMILFELSQTN